MLRFDNFFTNSYSRNHLDLLIILLVNSKDMISCQFA